MVALTAAANDFRIHFESWTNCTKTYELRKTVTELIQEHHIAMCILQQACFLLIRKLTQTSRYNNHICTLCQMKSNLNCIWSCWTYDHYRDIVTINFTEKEILRTQDERSETNPIKLEESQNSREIKKSQDIYGINSGSIIYGRNLLKLKISS